MTLPWVYDLVPTENERGKEGVWSYPLSVGRYGT